jgi:hypothetical protein
MTKVGGVDRPILFQVFERRVLTYNPANEPAFRVEMGNVGALLSVAVWEVAQAAPDSDQFGNLA